MKLAVIIDDTTTIPFTQVDHDTFLSTLTQIHHNIYVFDKMPHDDHIKILKQEGFNILFLRDLIKQSILYSPPSFSAIMDREETPIDNDILAKFYDNDSILVTGGEGFIGSNIVKNLLQLPISKVVVFGHGENSASDLCKLYGDDERFEFVLGDIRDFSKLQKTINHYKPCTIFHAAAHKHVPILEMYPEEAIKTNIIGTLNVINAAIEASVKKFVLVSTDKAVNPISALGASKRIAEKICLAMDQFVPHMRITTVRFGNVFGSVGSVVPIFLEQIAHDKPLTITDSSMLRYFMSVNEATRLVLLAATTDKGNLFSLNMGDSISIGDLAKKLVEYIGFTFDLDNVHIIGNRGGEKREEDLIYSFEKILASHHEKLLVLHDTSDVWSQEEVENLHSILIHAIEYYSKQEILNLLQKYVP